MLIFRMVIIGAVLWFAMRLVRRVMNAAAARKSGLAHQGKMVSCDICGVYLPEHDAIARRDGKFRCDQH